MLTLLHMQTFLIVASATAGSCPISQPLTPHCWFRQTECAFINVLNMFCSSEQLVLDYELEREKCNQKSPQCQTNQFYSFPLTRELVNGKLLVWFSLFSFFLWRESCSLLSSVAPMYKNKIEKKNSETNYMSPVFTSTADGQCPLKIIKKHSSSQCCSLVVFLKIGTPSAQWQEECGIQSLSPRGSEHLQISY